MATNIRPTLYPFFVPMNIGTKNGLSPVGGGVGGGESLNAVVKNLLLALVPRGLYVQMANVIDFCLRLLHPLPPLAGDIASFPACDGETNRYDAFIYKVNVSRK